MKQYRLTFGGWLASDVVWATVIVFVVTFLPLILGFELTLAADDQPALPLSSHGIKEHLPQLFQIFLSPSISLGNVLTLFGTLVWVGRWGTKTLSMVESVPQELSKLNDRLEILERQGCFRLDEHRAVIREIRRRGAGTGAVEEGDL